MTARILCVDDEPKVLRGLRRQLHDKFELELAEGPERALELLESAGPFGVVLADMRMPVMDGAQLLAEVRRLYPDTVRMMLTGNSDLLTAIRAVNEGNIFRFLNKPCAPEDLVRALGDGLEQYRLVCAEREILEQTLNGCVKVMSEALSLANPRSFRNTNELKELAEEVARALGMPRPWEMEMAVMFAQLGRVTIPPEILAKEEAGSPLSPRELGMLELIPSAGSDLIERIPRLEGVARIVKRQAADHDPRNEEDPPLGSRILRVLLDMVRMEESGLVRKKALASMSGDGGAHDPKVVEAVASCLGIGIEGSKGSRQITFDELRPGNVLAAPLVTRDDRLVLREGHLIGQVLMERLRNHHQMSGFREPIHIETRTRSSGRRAS